MINLAATYFQPPPPAPGHPSHGQMITSPNLQTPGHTNAYPHHNPLQQAQQHHPGLVQAAAAAAAAFHLPHYDPYGADSQRNMQLQRNGSDSSTIYTGQSDRSNSSPLPATPTSPLIPNPSPFPVPSSSPVAKQQHISHQQQLQSSVQQQPNYYEPAHFTYNGTAQGISHPHQASLASTYSVDALVASSNSTSGDNWPAIVSHVQMPLTSPSAVQMPGACTDALYPLSPGESEGKQDSGATSLKCNVCSKSCDSYHALKRHRREHLQRSGNDTAPIYSASCASNADLALSGMENGKPPSIDNLYQFIDESENEPVKKVRKYKKVKNPPASMGTTLEDGELPRPFFCELCGDRFTIKSSLVTHMRRHTGERPYQCSYCSKTFTQKGNLQTHIRTHTGEKPYKCSKCEKCYTSGAALNYHRNHHH